MRLGYFSAAFVAAMFSLSTIAQTTQPTDRKEGKAAHRIDAEQGVDPKDMKNTPTPPKSSSIDNAGAGESGPKAKIDAYQPMQAPAPVPTPSPAAK